VYASPARLVDQALGIVLASRAGDEAERHARRGVDPVGVVGDEQQRLLGGDQAEQVERRGRDGGGMGRRTARDAQRVQQRAALDGGQVADVPQERRQQAAQDGVRQDGLRLRRLGAQHAHAHGACRLRTGIQQRGLADTGLADERDGATGRRGRRLDDAAQGAQFAFPSVQHPARLSRNRTPPMLLREGPKE